MSPSANPQGERRDDRQAAGGIDHTGGVNLTVSPVFGFIGRRAVAYGAGVLFLWHLGLLWAWWSLPIVSEAHFAARRYEQPRYDLQPEDPGRPFARIRRGMNWDARLDGWIVLAIVGGLAWGWPGIVAAPLAFEALLTLHRLRRPATFWPPPPQISGGGPRPRPPRPPRPEGGSFDRHPRHPRPPIDADAIRLDVPEPDTAAKVRQPRRLAPHTTRPTARSTRSITAWSPRGPSTAPGA